MIDRYERMMSANRSAALERLAFSMLDEGNLAASEIHRLIIGVCANARLLTESVDGWAWRSAQRCDALGDTDLGDTLRRDIGVLDEWHAVLVDGPEHLISAWDANNLDDVEENTWHRMPVGSGVDHHIALNESVIESSSPYTKLAIELEVGWQWSAFLHRLYTTVDDLGSPTLAEHRSLIRPWVDDAANQSQRFRSHVHALLLDKPEAVEEVARVGALALSCFGEMLDDCGRWAVSGADRRV